MKTNYDVIVIGGGFFGMYIAEFYAKQGKKVILLEKEHDFMQRASYVNQARVHNGYHYPRSILTALRSRVSFPRFVDEFKDCIDDSFEKYYMIGRLLSNVTAKQFELFCHRIGVPCNRASSNITDLINPNLRSSFSRGPGAANVEPKGSNPALTAILAAANVFTSVLRENNGVFVFVIE